MDLQAPEHNSQHGRDHLHRLPNELLLEIFKWCPDFACLWSLIATSQRLAAVFDSKAREIVDHVLDSCFAAPIRRLMRDIVRIRLDSFAAKTLEEAGTKYVPPFSPGDTRTRRLLDMLNLFAPTPEKKDTPPPLDPTTPADVLRKLVYLAHNIHGLSRLYIDDSLRRCKLALPMPFVSSKDPEDQIPADEGTDAEDGSRDYRPETSPRPVSWREEQRILLAFWRLQYFFELKIGNAKRRIHWPPAELEILQSAEVQDIWGPELEGEQVLALLDFINDIKGRQPGVCQPIVGAQGPGSTGDRLLELQLPRVPAELYRVSRTIGSPIPSKGTNGFQKAVDSPLGGTPGYLNLLHLERGSGGDPLSKLPHAPYRKFGVFFWEQELLAELGFWPDRMYILNHELLQCYHIWRGLLSEAEYNEALEKQNNE